MSATRRWSLSDRSRLRHDRSAQAAQDVEALASKSPTALARVPLDTETPRGQENVGGGRDWERHGEIMAANEELLRRMAPIPPAMARAGRSRAISASDTLTFFVDTEGTCAAERQVRAVVRRVGNNAVWLDDIENPSGTFTDSQTSRAGRLLRIPCESRARGILR